MWVPPRSCHQIVKRKKKEYMSEGSFQLLTQPFVSADSTTYSDGQTIIGCGLTQEKKEAAKKPRFVDFACSHSEVHRYAVLVTEEVIPKALWGGRENFEIIKHCEYTVLGRQRLNLMKCRYTGIYRIAEVRDPVAAPRFAGDQDHEVRMVGTRPNRWKIKEAHACH